MKTIMIVDDKISVQRLIADYLSEHGFRTVMANNGREALYVSRHEKPDQGRSHDRVVVMLWTDQLDDESEDPGADHEHDRQDHRPVHIAGLHSAVCLEWRDLYGPGG